MVGAGLSGLSAAHWLTQQDVPCEVLERHTHVGGLARTVTRDGYRFDLGGYRFIGSSTEVHQLLQDLLGPDLLTVRATSKIYHRGRLFAYPLDPKDLAHGLGGQRSALALWSYTGSRIVRALPFRQRARTLEDWLLDEFGETLYRSFFRDYSEKIWGLPCHRLSAELASQRIHGMSLVRALARGMLPERLVGRGHRFLYPRFGIGQLSEAFGREVERHSPIRRQATVTKIVVRRARVEAVQYKDVAGETHETQGTSLISSVPLPRLLYLLSPRPPADVLAAARALLFRDVISVCLPIRRERVTSDSWLYVPDPAIGFARLLEPRNWSEAMTPPGRTSLVAEHYCFEGDKTWAKTDDELIEQTITDLAHKLKLVDRDEVLGGYVVRTRKPYPIYELGYHDHLARIHRYLKGIVNLQAIGRGGLFKYYNVGHLVNSGIRAAENVFGAAHDLWGLEADNLPQPGLFRV